MAITKTNFISYSRCPKCVLFEDIKKNKLDSDVSIMEYREEEKTSYLDEMINMFLELDKKDEQLEVMLPFYNKIEMLAGSLAPKYFKGSFKYAWDTLNQESFDTNINGIKYLCYVDIYNDQKDKFNIIEVKATTSNTFLTSHLFHKCDDGIYRIININDKRCSKLLDRYDSMGHYIFDLAVQRYIIEHDTKDKRVNYFLATLNSDYIFDGTYVNNEPVYNTDKNGNEIICYFDLTTITSYWMEKIDEIRVTLEKNLLEMKIEDYPLGEYCEYKKTYGCKFFNICSKKLPNKNSVLNYIDNHYGFTDGINKYSVFDLIKKGYYKIEDVPDNLLTREKNIIQKKCTLNNEIYANIDKIASGINELKYPIYHLDFETFPCPLPRFKGEKCYTQSVFQFSLHIEHAPGVCDKEKDHYGYLAKNNSDLREELIIKMIELIDTSKGTILVYNDSFEKSRLSELANIFPKYKDSLLKMKDMVFDLMNIVKTKSSLYESLGFSENESLLFNYYHKDMSGSFSIKKILPLFTDLSYKQLEVGNDTEALVTYAKYGKMNALEFEHKYNCLVEYCKQDTWAMVAILEGLRKLVKNGKRIK